MLTTQQISEIKKGIKLAVKQINLDGDKLFTEIEKEIKSIEKKIATIINKEKSYLMYLGYEITLNDKNTMNLNLQNTTIHNYIYDRNREILFDKLDVIELMK